MRSPYTHPPPPPTHQVISTVTRFLELLEERGKLVPKSQVEEDAESSAAALAQNALDPRARTVKEILESERKYVQDLEVLQVSAGVHISKEEIAGDCVGSGTSKQV